MIAFTNFNQGRLGNQLFFVASTIGIAIKNNTQYGFSSQLGHSGINYQSIFKNLLPIVNKIPERKYHQEGFNYYDIVIDDVELIGYFQSEKFFKHCEELVRHQFEFKSEIIDFVKEKYFDIDESLTIHIRRGDYVNQPNHHPLVSLDYYKKVLNDIQNNYKSIYIFSDDDEWVKNNFHGENFVFPKFESDNDLNCFVLMSLAQDSVISNSTYSWWAAWLNKNKNKKVFAPTYKQWFGVSYSNLDTKDLIPENWIQIEI